MLELFSRPETWVSLLTLTFLEVVLGIDNIIFVSIVAGKLPPEEQRRARTIGLTLALVFRVALLLGVSWIVKWQQPLFTIPIGTDGFGVAGRDLILFVGGLFLIWKSTGEIHDKFELADDSAEERKAALKRRSIGQVILQITLLDIVFSFDSILTAVGLAREVEIMIVAVVVAMGIMLAFSTPVANFVNRHASVKMLALSFLIMIGMMLVAEAAHFEIPKGYVYFAMAFSLMVEMLNLRLNRKNRLAAEARRLALQEQAAEKSSE